MSLLLHCVYVLQSLKDRKLYIGYSTDLKQRLTDHFHGQSKATAPRRPFVLIFCEYFFPKKMLCDGKNISKLPQVKKH